MDYDSVCRWWSKCSRIVVISQETNQHDKSTKFSKSITLFTGFFFVNDELK